MPKLTAEEVEDSLRAADKLIRKVVEAIEPFVDVNVCVAEGGLRVALMALEDARERLGSSL